MDINIDQELQNILTNSDESVESICVDKNEVIRGQKIPLDAVIIPADLCRTQAQVEASELDELMKSIRNDGLQNPIIIDNSGRLVQGMRRYTACKRLGVKEIPCSIIKVDTANAIRLGLVENLQRQDLSLEQEARSYEYLLKNYTQQYPNQKSLAEKLGVSESKVSKAMGRIGIQKKYNKVEATANEEHDIAESGIIASVDEIYIEDDENRKIEQPKKQMKECSSIPKQYLPDNVAATIFKNSLTVAITLHLPDDLSKFDLLEAISDTLTSYDDTAVMANIETIRSTLK